jgi:hypothetical protein
MALGPFLLDGIAGITQCRQLKVRSQRGRPLPILIQRNQQRASSLAGLRGIERSFQFGGDVAANWHSVVY